MKQIAYVGAWGADIQGQTKPKDGNGGVAAFEITQDNKSIFINQDAFHVNAGGLCVSADGKYVYTTDERKDLGGYHGNGGGVCAFKVKENGAVEYINEVSSAGAYPAYCTVDSKNRYVFAVNHGNHEEVVTRSVRSEDGTFSAQRVYDEGSLGMFPIRKDGSIMSCCELITFQGRSVLEWYQWTSHPHSVMLDPTEKYLLVGDKGCDIIRVYEVDYERGRLKEVYSALTPAGSGARHLAFHPVLPILYCNGEQDNSVMVYGFETSNGQLRLLQHIPTLPETYVSKDDPLDPFARSQTADIRVHKSGKYLYVTNRGDDSIACYKVDKVGLLTLMEIIPCGGKIPRAMNIDMSGDVLYVVNQRTGNIAQFFIDLDTGKLIKTGHDILVSNPVNIQFSYIP